MPDEIKKGKILLIDDDPTVIKLAGSLLQNQGYEVAAASEAPNGLEMAMKDRPDLIVLDVMMPIINGYNICRLMKNEETCRDIPIILLTSRAEDEDRKIGAEVGANAYLAKPINSEEFLRQVETLLSGI